MWRSGDRVAATLAIHDALRNVIAQRVMDWMPTQNDVCVIREPGIHCVR